MSSCELLVVLICASEQRGGCAAVAVWLLLLMLSLPLPHLQQHLLRPWARLALQYPEAVGARSQTKPMLLLLLHHEYTHGNTHHTLQFCPYTDIPNVPHNDTALKLGHYTILN